MLPPSGEIDYATASTMTYCQAVLTEALRLYPPAPLTTRDLESDLDIDGHLVPAGTMICLPVWWVHRSPMNWGDDADEFKPERHLERHLSECHVDGPSRASCATPSSSCLPRHPTTAAASPTLIEALISGRLPSPPSAHAGAGAAAAPLGATPAAFHDLPWPSTALHDLPAAPLGATPATASSDFAAKPESKSSAAFRLLAFSGGQVRLRLVPSDSFGFLRIPSDPFRFLLTFSGGHAISHGLP